MRDTSATSIITYANHLVPLSLGTVFRSHRPIPGDQSIHYSGKSVKPFKGKPSASGRAI